MLRTSRDCCRRSSQRLGRLRGCTTVALHQADPLQSPPQRRKVESVVSAERARMLASDLISRAGEFNPAISDSLVCDGNAPAIGFDCEGVRLGRYGRLCLLQIATQDGGVFICDALKNGVVEGLAPLLESRGVVKVVHDCREDSSALFHQHGVRLQSVFDTQAANMAIMKRRGERIRQCSMAEFLRTKLSVHERSDLADVKQAMLNDAKLWSRRPLTGILLRYLLHDANRLLPLRKAFLQDIHRGGHQQEVLLRKDVVNACQRALEHRHLNEDFETAASMARIRTRLWGIVAAMTPEGIYFKLNAGRPGVACTPSSMGRFRDVEVGDTVLCCVSGVSMDGGYLYLDRYDPDWDYFDHQLRPSAEPEVGSFGREYRHLTRATDDGDIDPLVARGLPALQTLPGGDFDEWETGTNDLGLPESLEDA